MKKKYHLSRTRKLLVALVGTVVLLVSILFYSYKTANQLFGNFNWINHTNHVKDQLDTIILHLLHLESHTRAYIITGQENIINDVNSDFDNLKSEVEVLRILISDNPGQLRRVEILNFLVDRRINLLKKAVKSRTTGIEISSPAMEHIILEGIKLTSQILDLKNRMKEEEDKLLYEREGEAKELLNITKEAIFMASGVSLLSIFLIAFLIDSDNKRKILTTKNLSDLDKNKNKFFSIISHDLRGPIHAITKLVGFLKDENVSQTERQQMVKLIESSSIKAGNLLENLLKWAQVQMNKLDFVPEAMNLRDVADTAIISLKLSAQIKKIEIKNNLLNESVYGDREMIITVIRNLIANALKFSFENNVILLESQIFKNNVVIKVQDFGIGMRPEISSKLFLLQEISSLKGTMNETGTGLGLQICKEFVERNNGQIWVESKMGEGSAFYFTIPLFNVSLHSKNTS